MGPSQAQGYPGLYKAFREGLSYTPSPAPLPLILHLTSQSPLHLNLSDTPVWEASCFRGWPSVQPELFHIFEFFFSFPSAWFIDIGVLVSLKARSASSTSVTVRSCSRARPIWSPALPTSSVPITSGAVFFIPGSLSCIWPVTSESLRLGVLEPGSLHMLTNQVPRLEGHFLTLTIDRSLGEEYEYVWSVYGRAAVRVWRPDVDIW